jgi:hypothetical protein
MGTKIPGGACAAANGDEAKHYSAPFRLFITFLVYSTQIVTAKY